MLNISHKIKKKKEKGSITVEATLVLPIVILTLLFIANILNVCMVHLCMQQALNNTVKKISQDSYIVYRFAGVEKYEKLMNSLNETIKNYDTLGDEIVDLKTSFENVQKSFKETVKHTSNLVHTFDGITIDNMLDYPPKFANNVTNLSTSSETSINNANKLIEDVKKVLSGDNYKPAFVKLLLDTSVGAVTTTVADFVFENYKKDLQLPASRIKNLDFFNTSINNDGMITLCIKYYYINPFSFTNDPKLEKTIINRDIKMVNIISVKPFVGKSKTSIKEKLLGDGIGVKDEEIVYIPDSAYDVDDDAKRKYHSDPYCSGMKGHVQRVKLSDVGVEGNKIDGACSKCYNK